MIGHFKAIPICTDRHGNTIPPDEAARFVEHAPVGVSKNNLVLNLGRKRQAEFLGGRAQRVNSTPAYIDRLILGVGPKAGNPPHLSNTFESINQIRKLNGTPFGIFHLFDEDIFYPDSMAVIPHGLSSGWANGTATLSSDGTFICDGEEDLSAVRVIDQVTLDHPDETRLSIREIVSDVELKLHNPSGLEFGGRYRIDSAGTQVVFSKLIRGNMFPPDEFGPVVLVQEAGLLFTDSVLLNRVIYGGVDDDSGIPLQSDLNPSGIELSYRFEFTMTM